MFATHNSNNDHITTAGTMWYKYPHYRVLGYLAYLVPREGKLALCMDRLGTRSFLYKVMNSESKLLMEVGVIAFMSAGVSFHLTAYYYEY